MFNKKFAIGFITLIFIVSALGLYHRHKTQKILNAEPTKVYKVNTAIRDKQPQSIAVENGNQEIFSETENGKDVKNGVGKSDTVDNQSSEKLGNSQSADFDGVLKQSTTGDIATGDIAIGTANTEKEKSSNTTDNPSRRLTRDEMIDLAVAAGMPREQAEKMQPLAPGTFDDNLSNTLQVISDIISTTIKNSHNPDRSVNVRPKQLTSESD
jgi:hypothetical protein